MDPPHENTTFGMDPPPSRSGAAGSHERCRPRFGSVARKHDLRDGSATLLDLAQRGHMSVVDRGSDLSHENTTFGMDPPLGWIRPRTKTRPSGWIRLGMDPPHENTTFGMDPPQPRFGSVPSHENTTFGMDPPDGSASGWIRRTKTRPSGWIRRNRGSDLLHENTTFGMDPPSGWIRPRTKTRPSGWIRRMSHENTTFGMDPPWDGSALARKHDLRDGSVGMDPPDGSASGWIRRTKTRPSGWIRRRDGSAGWIRLGMDPPHENTTFGMDPPRDGSVGMDPPFGMDPPSGWIRLLGMDPPPDGSASGWIRPVQHR
jgi:hypothetical protein